MAQLSFDKTREIIDDFVKVINERKTEGSAPKMDVINFRDDKIVGRERPIYNVPIELLRYRKDNGRIASDVLSYEKVHLKELDEKDDNTQKILFEFLKRDDPEKTEVLKRAIQSEGQDEPAIITCDGFLINGNRRRMVLQLLSEEDDPSKYSTMKVIILPGKGDPGGPPTIKEIELIENRYQLQQDGKSEYKGLNRALSILRKINCGISLEDQLLDDPSCGGLKKNSKEFKKKIDEVYKNLLKPLERAEAYLAYLERPGYYDSIKDRWQAFIDFSNFYNGNLQDHAWQIKASISEDDIGTIQDVAFKIIRKQTIKGEIPRKLHQIIRDIPKFMLIEEAQRNLLNISDEVKELTNKEKLGEDGKELDFDDQDIRWGEVNKGIFERCINKAYGCFSRQEEESNPLKLIIGAFDKLTHKNMNIQKIPIDKLTDFVKDADKVIQKATELRSDAWYRKKNRCD